MRTATDLIDATIAVAAAGVPLMLRVVPADAPTEVWAHYPADDAVDPIGGARWFYHAHPPGERVDGEHGHFHLFLARDAFGASAPLAGPPGGVSSGADVVHIIAITIDERGLPTQLFTVNRWVTDEWLYPASAIAAAFVRFDLVAAGDPLVDRWLTAAVAFFRPQIEALLGARDAAITAWPDGDIGFEDRGREILSSAAIDINEAVAAAAR